MSDATTRSPVAVLGLGRFGRACAEGLSELHIEVLALDRDLELVNEVAGSVTLALQANVADVGALRRLGLAEYQRAVVGVGQSLEGSILAVSALVDLGVPEIWAKAVNPEHGRILRRLGATRVVYPEGDAGRQTAHALAYGTSGDIAYTADGYALTLVPAPAAMLRRALGDVDGLPAPDVQVLAVRRRGARLAEPATPQTRVEPGDALVVMGPATVVDALGP